jgi:hypothetical protein
MSKFRVNRTRIPERREKKKDNIFILTRDNYYFILEKKYLLKSRFFVSLFDSEYGVGYLRKPIFLQKINSKYFKLVIDYLKYYEGKREKKWENDGIITIHKLLNIYDNDWDKKFITNIKNNFENNIEDFEELLKVLSYMAIDNLYEKVKYCYDFIINTKKYKLDEIDNDFELDYKEEYEETDSEETDEDY